MFWTRNFASCHSNLVLLYWAHALANAPACWVIAVFPRTLAWSKPSSLSCILTRFLHIAHYYSSYLLAIEKWWENRRQNLSTKLKSQSNRTLVNGNVQTFKVLIQVNIFTPICLNVKSMNNYVDFHKVVARMTNKPWCTMCLQWGNRCDFDVTHSIISVKNLHLLCCVIPNMHDCNSIEFDVLLLLDLWSSDTPQASPLEDVEMVLSSTWRSKPVSPSTM